jgi:hypothetical protein
MGHSPNSFVAGTLLKVHSAHPLLDVSKLKLRFQREDGADGPPIYTSAKWNLHSAGRMLPSTSLKFLKSKRNPANRSARKPLKGEQLSCSPDAARTASLKFGRHCDGRRPDRRCFQRMKTDPRGPFCKFALPCDAIRSLLTMAGLGFCVGAE